MSLGWVKRSEVYLSRTEISLKLDLSRRVLHVVPEPAFVVGRGADRPPELGLLEQAFASKIG